MSEDKNKQSKIVEGLRVLISSPINTLLAIALLYFATKVYLFNGTMTDKLFMLGVMGIWIFWFIIKHINYMPNFLFCFLTYCLISAIINYI